MSLQQEINRAQNANTRPQIQDLYNRIDMAMKRSQESGRPFMFVTIQIAHMPGFRKRCSQVVVYNFFRELYNGVRQAVHPSQFVGMYQDGLGLVFESADVGQVDNMCRKLLALAQHIIRSGRYNDLSSRWSDIIRQFLMPGNDVLIYPKIGWAIYPRDGASSKELTARALQHIVELSR